MCDFTPDKVIAVDSGANALYEFEAIPDYVLGDFDSIDPKVLEHYGSCSNIIRSPIEKDETDTELAIRKAVELNAGEIVILGATGSRLDHTLGNIFLLKKVQGYGITCVLVDDEQEISLMNNKKEFFFYARKNCITYITYRQNYGYTNRRFLLSSKRRSSDIRRNQRYQ